MMKSTLIKDLYGEIERLKAGKNFWIPVFDVKMLLSTSNSVILLFDMFTCVICTYHPEVYAAREKNGVYIPKDRYYQEESEKKVLDLSCLVFLSLFEQFFTFLFLYSSVIDLWTVEDSSSLIQSICFQHRRISVVCLNFSEASLC